MGRVRGRSSSTIQIFKSSMGLSRRMCRIFVLSTFGPLRPEFARKAVKAACMQKGLTRELVITGHAMSE